MPAFQQRTVEENPAQAAHQERIDAQKAKARRIGDMRYWPTKNDQNALKKPKQ